MQKTFSGIGTKTCCFSIKCYFVVKRLRPLFEVNSLFRTKTNVRRAISTNKRNERTQPTFSKTSLSENSCLIFTHNRYISLQFDRFISTIHRQFFHDPNTQTIKIKATSRLSSTLLGRPLSNQRLSD